MQVFHTAQQIQFSGIGLFFVVGLKVQGLSLSTTLQDVLFLLGKHLNALGKNAEWRYVLVYLPTLVE